MFVIRSLSRSTSPIAPIVPADVSLSPTMMSAAGGKGKDAEGKSEGVFKRIYLNLVQAADLVRNRDSHRNRATESNPISERPSCSAPNLATTGDNRFYVENRLKEVSAMSVMNHARVAAAAR